MLIYEREKERDFSLGLFAFRNAFKRNYFVPRTRKYSFLIKLEKKLNYTYRIRLEVGLLNIRVLRMKINVPVLIRFTMKKNAPRFFNEIEF